MAIIWTGDDEETESIREDVARDKQVDLIHYVTCVTGHEVDEREVSELSNGDLICNDCGERKYGESL